MSECHISGCRNLDTKCADCGRLVISRIMPPLEPQMMKKLMDLHQIIHDLQEKLHCRWISIKDRLPEEGELVLTNRGASSDLRMEVDYLVYFEDGHKTWSCTREKEQSLVTHWMPLPHPPKE